MKSYSKDMGRIRIRFDDVSGESHAVLVAVRSGWNEASRFVESVLSIEEARDLRYLLDRVIAASE